MFYINFRCRVGGVANNFDEIFHKTIKIMKKIILIVFAGLLLFSCGTTKKLSESDKTESDKTVERRSVTRPGDTITIDIPNVRYKDTVITRVNYENRTVATVRYDKDGNQQFECLSAELKEEMELIRETIKNDVESKTDIEREFKPQHFIYALVALVAIIIIGIAFVYFALMKMKKSIPDIVAGVVKK